MRSGIMFGAAAMLDGLLDRMEQELGTPATVVATGGISNSLCRCAAESSSTTAP